MVPGNGGNTVKQPSRADTEGGGERRVGERVIWPGMSFAYLVWFQE